MYFLGKVFRKFGRLSLLFADVLDPPPPPPPPPAPPPLPTEKEIAHAKWVSDNGDKTLRLNYSLEESDVVVDLGGFEGQWASDIYSRYRCKVHVFEPVSNYALAISNRFKNNPDIFVHQFALGSSEGEFRVSISGDASSAFSEDENFEMAKVVSFGSWMANVNINNIALLKINIEGGEYDLLDYILDSGFANFIGEIQIQFHDFVPDSDSRMKNILDRLSGSHFPTYQYKYVWENWRRKI